MSKKNQIKINRYDEMQNRLESISKKLISVNSISINDLLDEFSVSKRTLQRDIKKLSETIKIQKNGTSYSIDNSKIINNKNFDAIIIYNNKIDKSIFQNFKAIKMEENKIFTTISIYINKNDLFKLIKCNLPYIKIIKPERLKLEFNNKLLEYLK
jgi:DeoR/GlpR family transcriptional regulator of sugar metabolism